MTGTTLPSGFLRQGWPCTVVQSMGEKLYDPFMLLDTNPSYAHACPSDRRETTVSVDVLLFGVFCVLYVCIFVGWM